jgi:Transglutaminase-like superfamily
MIDRRSPPAPPPFVMAYTLKPGISFCHVAGRTIFLDLRADRYFCLANDAERSFDRLAAASSGPEDMRILEGLAHQGILRASDTGSILQPCPAVTEARASLLDAAPTPVRPLQTLLAGTALLHAPLRLRLFGLHAAVARLQARKARLKTIRSERETLARGAAAFAQLRAIATTHDQCLPRSLAVTDRLLAAGVRAELVLAVKLQPFAAHAWVQWQDLVVNDRVDAVRDFTPILVV